MLRIKHACISSPCSACALLSCHVALQAHAEVASDWFCAAQLTSFSNEEERELGYDKKVGHWHLLIEGPSLCSALLI